jgi:hypothetical protein
MVADTQASASATINTASLTGVIERRVTVASGMTVTPTAGVTLGVTEVVTMISSVLRRCSRPPAAPSAGERPHPVPAPVAPELRRASRHTSIRLRAQPIQRLAVIECAARSSFGHDEYFSSTIGRRNHRRLSLGRSDGNEG